MKYVIFREQRLKDDMYRCHFTLSGFYLKQNNPEKALQNIKNALGIAKEKRDKFGEVEILTQMGLVRFHFNLRLVSCNYPLEIFSAMLLLSNDTSFFNSIHDGRQKGPLQVFPL